MSSHKVATELESSGSKLTHLVSRWLITPLPSGCDGLLKLEAGGLLSYSGKLFFIALLLELGAILLASLMTLRLTKAYRSRFKNVSNPLRKLERLCN